MRAGGAVSLPDRHFDVLAHLAANAGTVLSKDALIQAAWQDVAVTDNSLEQAISALRKTLGDAPDGQPYIQTVARRGYRFTADIARITRRATDEELAALLAPHQSWLEGRAALETMAQAQVAGARQAFARVLEASPDYAPAHVGMANACTFLFESTRADVTPDVAALTLAVQHARDACRLDPSYAEAWSTLAVAVHRAGDATQALAAVRRAIALEPDSWKHYLRLAFVSWGDERVRAAARALKLLPGLALAHWLAASVHVARQALDAADSELAAGVAAQDAQHITESRFGGIGVHWLQGLVHLARGDTSAARASLERELTFEQSGHLYARECCANAWYALGALHHREGDAQAARAAFEQALERIPGHPLASTALAALADAPVVTRAFKERVDAARERAPVEAALATAVFETLRGSPGAHIQDLQAAFAASKSPLALWYLPVEPVLNVSVRPQPWASLLAAIRTRAM